MNSFGKHKSKILISNIILLILIAFLASMLSCGGGGVGGGETTTYYHDGDGDGYGNPGGSKVENSQPDGYVKDNTDWNDNDAKIYPGAEEICDNIDNNCNSQVDEGLTTTYYIDADGDGYGDPEVSQDACSQPSGYVTDSTDCDDTDASINPVAEEITDDGIDNDCDGLYAKTYYEDADGDGYGNPEVSQVDTSQPYGYVTDNTDCNDNNAYINPGMTEIIGDWIDQNCNGMIDEIQVPGHYSTIQEAIDASSDGDTVLVDDGAYVENIKFNGKAVTVKSDNGAESTIIDGNASGSVVTFSSGEKSGSVLDGFTVTNGSAEYGGGIYCSSSDPTITNCIVRSNASEGIYCKYSDSKIINCTIRNNIGAGILCDYYSSTIISDCIISGNLNDGIGCYLSSTTISNCTITDNSHYGIWCRNSSSPTITDCTISRNGSGGIYCRRNSSPTITDCTITYNSNDRGDGGIYCYENSSPTITN